METPLRGLTQLNNEYQVGTPLRDSTQLTKEYQMETPLRGLTLRGVSIWYSLVS